jgi:hypothetical protein
MKLSKEHKELLDFIFNYASTKEIIIFVWWTIFYKNKIKKFIENIENGRTWKSSFDVAKNFK